jgi:MinD-like ATPase involved in chromosome partitioning or flagellar assembly
MVTERDSSDNAEQPAQLGTEPPASEQDTEAVGAHSAGPAGRDPQQPPAPTRGTPPPPPWPAPPGLDRDLRNRQGPPDPGERGGPSPYPAAPSWGGPSDELTRDLGPDQGRFNGRPLHSGAPTPAPGPPPPPRRMDPAPNRPPTPRLPFGHAAPGVPEPGRHAGWSAQGVPQHGRSESEATRGADRGPASGGYPTPAGPSWYDDHAPAAASPGNWSYVDSIRTSELVPTRKIPPGRGWRKFVFKTTFGLINLGPSPDERRQAALEGKVRSLLRGHYKIGVLGKGGTGKTTITAAVGSMLAELRQEDRVVAVDADTAFGKLGMRVDPNVAGSYWELAADQHLHSFADVRSRVGSNAAGLFVLAGETATARRRVLDPAIYREATARLDNHFTVSIVDCGSTMDSAVTQEVLRDLDALIVVSSPWVDAASAAGQTLEWLANNGYTGLLHRTVVVLNDSDGHVDKRTRQLLVEQFGSRGQVVVEVPFDAHLRPGGVVDIDNEMDRLTRRRILEIAAAIAEHFAATTDGPRGPR